MSQPISGTQRFPTNRQVPDHAIMDFYNKQVYLGNQYIGSSGVVALADTSEHPILYLLNPASSTISLFVATKKLFAGDVTNSVIFNLYSTPTTVAAGSAITPVNSRILSSSASVATLKKTVTAGANGTLIEAMPTGLGFSPIDSSSMLILDPGASILITAKGSAATNCVAELVWYEL